MVECELQAEVVEEVRVDSDLPGSGSFGLEIVVRIGCGGVPRFALLIVWIGGGGHIPAVGVAHFGV